MIRSICVSELRGQDPPTYFRVIPRDISNMIDEYLAASGCIRRVSEPMQLVHTYPWIPPAGAQLRYLGLRLYFVEAQDYAWLDHDTCYMIIRHVLHLFRAPVPGTPSASPIGLRPTDKLDLRTAFGLPKDSQTKFWLDTYGRPCYNRSGKTRTIIDPFGAAMIATVACAPTTPIIRVGIVGVDAAGAEVSIRRSGSLMNVIITLGDEVTIRPTTIPEGRASLGPDGHLHIACTRTGRTYAYR